MQQRDHHAAAVLVGTPLRRDGGVRIYGYEANIHEVAAERVLKGDVGSGSVRVASMPVTCGQSYPDGDPLDAGGRQLLFLTKQNGEWFTMTPDQGSFPSRQAPRCRSRPAEWRFSGRGAGRRTRGCGTPP